MKCRILARFAVASALLFGMISPTFAQSGRPRPLPPTNNPQSESPQPSQTPKAPGNKPASAKEETQKTGGDDVATIKLDTTLVTIPVSVLDRNGRYIPHLNKNDFRVFEDGVEQEVSDLGTVETPFHVVLLLDTSPSQAFNLRDIQEAAIAFVDQLHANDRVMVVSFDRDVHIDSEFTSDRARLRRAIYGTYTDNSTKLYDAVDLVITERLNRIDGRKAIVLFTDGVDTASRIASARSTVARVEESGVLVYPIQYNTANDMGPFGRGGGGGRGRGRGGIMIPWPSPRFPGGNGNDEYSRASEYLRDLAERSGARLHQADTLGNLSNAFSMIAEELRYQYSLSYYPTNAARDGSYRRVRVTVNQSNAVVRAREGYRASSDEHPQPVSAPARPRR